MSDNRSRAIAAFQKADTNRKGSLTSIQFYEATKTLNLGYSFAEAFEVYKNFDKNHDFEVDQNEFIGFLESCNYAKKMVDLTNATNVKIHPGYQSHFQAENVPEMLKRSGHLVTSSGGIMGGNSSTFQSSTSFTYPQTSFTQPQTTTSTYIQPQTSTSTYIQSQPTSSYTQQTYVQSQPTTTYTQQTYVQPQTTTTYVQPPVQSTYIQSVPAQPTYVQFSQPAQPSFAQFQAPNQTSYVQAPANPYLSAPAGATGAIAKYDQAKKGWLNREELRTACKDLGVRCNTEEELDTIFSEIDDNRTGRINPREFQEFYDYVNSDEFITKQ